MSVEQARRVLAIRNRVNKRKLAYLGTCYVEVLDTKLMVFRIMDKGSFSYHKLVVTEVNQNTQEI